MNMARLLQLLEEAAAIAAAADGWELELPAEETLAIQEVSEKISRLLDETRLQAAGIEPAVAFNAQCARVEDDEREEARRRL